jgi:hypothetical protein
MIRFIHFLGAELIPVRMGIEGSENIRSAKQVKL